MKKKILLIISVVLSTVTFAQQAVNVGIKTGLSIAYMRGDAISSLQQLLDFSNGMITTGSSTGFFAGGFINVPVSKAISIEPALYYSQKGYQLNGELAIKGMEFLNAKAKLQSNYIEMPVLVKATLSGFEVFAGPQVSYLISANLKTTAGAFGFNLLNSKVNATQQINRWDMGLTAGVGYKFTNGLNISVSYDHGLAKADANKNLSAYNSSFKVGVGVSF